MLKVAAAYTTRTGGLQRAATTTAAIQQATASARAASATATVQAQRVAEQAEQATRQCGRETVRGTLALLTILFVLFVAAG